MSDGPRDRERRGTGTGDGRESTRDRGAGRGDPVRRARERPSRAPYPPPGPPLGRAASRRSAPETGLGLSRRVASRRPDRPVPGRRPGCRAWAWRTMSGPAVASGARGPRRSPRDRPGPRVPPAGGPTHVRLVPGVREAPPRLPRWFGAG